MKHLFIVNPAAGKGKTLELIPHIEEIFKNSSQEHFIEITKEAGHAAQIAKQYSSLGDYRIYSVGGDGTLNEVLNGMAGSSCSLAVIPTGTGNDFVKNIYKFNEDVNLVELLRKTIKGTEKNIDIGKINNRFFLNISSAGFDAEVVKHSINFKKLPLIGGKTAYILGILKTVFRYNSHRLTIDIDGKSFIEDVLLIAVANGKYYGGGMMVAPQADISDGAFNICVIRKVNKLKILALFPRLIKGTHENIKEVSFYSGACVRISCNKEIAFNIDGELLAGKEAFFELLSSSLKIVLPSED